MTIKNLDMTLIWSIRQKHATSRHTKTNRKFPQEKHCRFKADSKVVKI